MRYRLGRHDLGGAPHGRGRRRQGNRHDRQPHAGVFPAFRVYAQRRDEDGTPAGAGAQEKEKGKFPFAILVDTFPAPIAILAWKESKEKTMGILI